MSLGKACEITEHRLAIVRNENSRRFRGNGEHLGIGNADNTALMSAEDINGRLPPGKANYDFVVEIGIRLEPRPHVLGVCVLRRASASLAYKAGWSPRAC